MMRLESAALAYARAGFAVIPLSPNGKQPLTKRGVHDATSDVATVRRWWSARPGANIGLAVRPDWLVVDVDVRSGGPGTVNHWEAEHGQLPVTPTQRTASGGTHYVFQRPSCEVRGKAGCGVDVLGVGRYIVASPSVIGGAAYEWRHRLSSTPLASLPPWLHALVSRPALASAPAPEVERASVDVIERARRYIARCEPAISGQGGHTATFLVAQILARGFGLDDASALHVMQEWNAKCVPPWSERDLKRKIKQARERGSFVVGSLRDAPRRSA